MGSVNVSYFINGNVANDADPQMVLSGDENIGTASAPGVNAPATGRLTAPQLYGGKEWGWTTTDLHQGNGNLLLADGSVQSASQGQLRTYLAQGTNTCAAPCFNFYN